MWLVTKLNVKLWARLCIISWGIVYMHKHKYTVAVTKRKSVKLGSWCTAGVPQLTLQCVPWLRGCFSNSDEGWIHIVLPPIVRSTQSMGLL